MTDAFDSKIPFATGVLHPTDFSDASDSAFAHALAISLIRGTSLHLLRADRDHFAEDKWREFPPVRKTLERWGALEPNSPMKAVLDELDIAVRKIQEVGKSPTKAILDHIEETEPNVLILATEGRRGLPSWLKPSVAEAVARRSKIATLFVPSGARGIVNIDGQVQLERILVPVAKTPDAFPALVYAARAVRAFADKPVTIFVLHVGDEASAPNLVLPIPQNGEFLWQEITRKGDAADKIVEVADEYNVDLIAMSTDGRDSFMDVFRGSHSERVVRHANCPVLAVPKESIG